MTQYTNNDEIIAILDHANIFVTTEMRAMYPNVKCVEIPFTDVNMKYSIHFGINSLHTEIAEIYNTLKNL